MLLLRPPYLSKLVISWWGLSDHHVKDSIQGADLHSLILQLLSVSWSWAAYLFSQEIDSNLRWRMLRRLYCLLTWGQLIMHVPKAGHSDGMLRDSCTHLSITHIDIVIFIVGPVGSKEQCSEKTLKIRQVMLNKGKKRKTKQTEAQITHL